MKLLLFLFILLFGIQAQAFEVKVRDSLTGASIAAKIEVSTIKSKKLSKSQWHKIRMGQPYDDSISAVKTFVIQPQYHKFNISNSTDLQILKVTADNYSSNQTYVEASQKVLLTDIFMDSLTDSHVCDGMQICGYLYDKNSVNPLAGALLELSNNQHRYLARSDEDGLFKFEQGIPNDATLVASHLGYRTQIWNAISLKASFNMIIDMEQGSGIIEHSMHHPLMDLKNNNVDPQWLQAKLSQVATTDIPEIKERPGGGLYIQPPANIRVGFNSSGGTCCGSNCSSSQVYSLESYVQRGLDNEWISSWNQESLKAGSIPYRSYGAWHVLNPPYTGYDICAGPCCQAFGNTSYTATVNAAKATAGIMLEIGGVLARSEYSAQNNSWDDPNDGLSCTNADLSCGDGSVGSPATGWPCLSDPSSIGKGCFGHGRGMSQWGSQFNALAGDGFADIVDFYYNAKGNPSGQRSQYNTSPIKIDAISSSLNTVQANLTFAINIQIYNANAGLFGPIILGASLINSNAVYSDSSNDDVFTTIPSGTNSLNRNFSLPSNVQTGVYDLLTAVYLDVDHNNIITAADWALVSFRLNNHITISDLPDLMFSDSFE